MSIPDGATRILDHGYLKLVEVWGKGEAGRGGHGHVMEDDHEVGIIEAARQSTQKAFCGWETDAKLLKYLFNNGHTTPFEFSGMTIEVQAPLIVFREWHRHRTQCLAGDTQVTLVSPRGTTFKRTIKEIYDLKHGGAVDTAPAFHRNGSSKAGTPVVRLARRKDAWRTRVLPNCQDRMLRVLDEATGLFHVAPMADVWVSGEKVLYAVEAGGRVVRASVEHPFFTRRGWVKVKDLKVGDELARMGKVSTGALPIPPALRQGIGVWTTMMRARLIGANGDCYLCGQNLPSAELQLDHVVPVSVDLQRALDPSNLQPVCVSCHRAKTDTEQPSREGMTRRGVRWERIERLPKAVGKEQTYDIEVAGPHHNYLANDLVVHNSYSEMSARYSPLPDVHYMPTNDRLLLVNGHAAKKNKQAGAVAGAPEMTHAVALAWLARVHECYELCEAVYQEGLTVGVPKEVARIVNNVGRYSRMRATANLRNWLAFMTLRCDPLAQWEIRQFAWAVYHCVERCFPQTLRLWHDKVAARWEEAA